MATTAQILANQENSKLSTGPRTPEGKAAASANATTHGLSAASPVLPHEDRDEFNKLLHRNKSEWEPSTAHEEFLVNQMTGARWKLARIDRIEIEMFTTIARQNNQTTSDTGFAEDMLDKERSNAFAKLNRYRMSLERTYHRCVRELNIAQKEQKEAKREKAKRNEMIESAIRGAERRRQAAERDGTPCTGPRTTLHPNQSSTTGKPQVETSARLAGDRRSSAAI